ncbi:MAG: Acetoacetyl-CoA synthetase [Burkholderiaceae bacterium]|jgi:acetoacetyl-CoA synthetase|nr:MAG: Acetoacetyl-CoA synthetase [Burkholderiaceae bacterium]
MRTDRSAPHVAPDIPPDIPYVPQIRLYQDWLREQRGLAFDDYEALRRWSVTDLEAFWQSIWDYFDLQSPTPHDGVLADPNMPGARWFPGARVNYASQVFRHADAAHAAGMPAIVAQGEIGGTHELSWPELKRQAASLALHLKAAGLQPGDRVAVYLPNIPETMVAFLAVASIGAVWSLCAPDMGSNAVLDRFRQIEPKVLIACDGVRYGGRELDRTGVVAELRAALPTLEHVIALNLLSSTNTIADSEMFSRLVARSDAEVLAFEPEPLAFDHPLWIVYSSGTTGLPKAIVHGHGGIVLVALAEGVLHRDVGPSYAANSFGERFHWYSTTGWIMWNAQVNGLLGGATICLFDGSPGGSRERPDWGRLWRFVAETGVTFFGAGAAFYASCMKAELDLRECGDLGRVRALGSTGSPLSEDVQRWGSEQFRNLRERAGDDARRAGPPQASAAPSGGSGPRAAGERGGDARRAGPPQASAAPSGGSGPRAAGERGGDARRAGPPQASAAPSGGSGPRAAGERGGDIWWCNISGGTDFAGAFIGGNRELPQVFGAMQCRLLGCAVEAWNEQGEPVTDAVGELVCTRPIPSMPLYFWGDHDETPVPRDAAAPAGAPAPGPRYRASYFDVYPGVWRHGDWLKIGFDGSCVIYGRSDATINRHGLRMGTSELYRAVEALPEVIDSLVVDLEYLGRASYMPLFVVLREGLALDDGLRRRIGDAIRNALSPRFVPDEVLQVAEVPRTLSGKKQELPIKKLLLGQPAAKVLNRDAMANPGCLDWYIAFAKQRLAEQARHGGQ